MKHPAIRFSIAILISVGALYLAFRGVSLSLLLAELAKTNIWLILLGVALLFCSHVCRAWRWTVIVRPMKAKTSALVGFRAIMGGYAMNNIIPRSGELVRPYIFAKHEKVFMSGTIATILIERVVDLIANILFIMLALVIFPREIAAGFPAIAGSMTGIAIGGFVVLALVMIMIFSAGKTERTLHRITANWPEKIRAPIYRAASEFASGLRGVRASGAWPVVLGTVVFGFFTRLVCTRGSLRSQNARLRWRELLARSFFASFPGLRFSFRLQVALGRIIILSARRYFVFSEYRLQLPLRMQPSLMPRSIFSQPSLVLYSSRRKEFRSRTSAKWFVHRRIIHQGNLPRHCTSQSRKSAA